MTARPRTLFTLTLLAGSFLLFLMQPLVARIALPRLGGAPAVWTSAMLVYQALLLGGYAYAHALGRLPPRRQAAVHLGAFALAALWLPLGLADRALPPGAEPILWVPALLVGSVGPLFLVVAAQAPLMQRWFALAAPGQDPFPLYAASNLGSFAGLIAYPLLMEPLMDVAAQRLLWSVGFVLLAALMLACARALPRSAALPALAAAGAAPGVGRVAWWMALAAVPSGLILSTSTHLGTDLVAMPLLWVVPLGLYLLSFVVAFSERGWADRIAAAFPFALPLAAGTAFASGTGATPLAVGAALIFLFVAATTLHRRLYRLRPEAGWLTAYYLALAAGGALGGLFCAVAAPVIFDWGYEGPILILAAAALAGGRRWGWLDGRGAAVLAVAGGLLGAAAGALFRVDSLSATLCAVTVGLAVPVVAGRAWPTLLLTAGLMLASGGWSTLETSAYGGMRTRSWFGIYTVANRGPVRELISGTTLHGMQRRLPGEETWPISYYAPSSGVGEALRLAPVLYGPGARIGVVGLGTGTLACYAKRGQSWSFFEIDPAMIAIARDPAKFSFLSRCAPDARMVLGDARLSLAEEPAGSLDVLAVDAFLSDAVPMHLLTREAFAVYARVLAPGGLLVVHVSNRFLDLEPVVAASAAAGGWTGWIKGYRPGPQSSFEGAIPSLWIVLSRRAGPLDRLVRGRGDKPGGWQRLEPRPGFRGWTDDHASLLPVLR